MSVPPIPEGAQSATTYLIVERARRIDAGAAPAADDPASGR